MTFVEILVAVSLLGVLALLTMNMTALLRQSTTYGDRSQAFMALTGLIRQHMKYSNLCEQAIGQSSTYNQNFDLTNPEIQMALPNIKSGPLMNQNFIRQNEVVLPLRLKIESLALRDLVNITGTKYVGQVYLAASALDGIAFKAVPLGTVQLDIIGVSPNMQIVNCYGVESGVSKTMCQSMGCTWDSMATPDCQCVSANGICPLGELPVAIKSGIPDCRPLGGKSCAANEYLVGVGIEKTYCAPVY